MSRQSLPLFAGVDFFLSYGEEKIDSGTKVLPIYLPWSRNVKQSDRANVLLKALRHRIEVGVGPIHGYEVAAKIIGWESDASIGRAMAQVCSRVDLACFNAGLPMLAFHMVRTHDGRLNPLAFQGVWAEHRGTIESVSQSYVWGPVDLDRVQNSLDQLRDEAAIAMWRHAEERGSQYIRYNLHRRAQSAT